MILTGSCLFFGNYPDFKPHDKDYIIIERNPEYRYLRHLHGKDIDVFYNQKLSSTQEYINFALDDGLGMSVVKFLTPEFNKAIGFTINDLPKVKPLIDKLDEKHLYVKIIYEAYLENNDFILTQEQRDKAYTAYKEARKNIVVEEKPKIKIYPFRRKQP